MKRYTVYLGYAVPFRVRAWNTDDAIAKAIAKAHKQFPPKKK